MPRHPYKKRAVKSDPLHSSHEVSKLVNYVMYSASRDKPGYSSTPSYVAESAAGKENTDDAPPLIVKFL